MKKKSVCEANVLLSHVKLGKREERRRCLSFEIRWHELKRRPEVCFRLSESMPSRIRNLKFPSILNQRRVRV